MGLPGRTRSSSYCVESARCRLARHAGLAPHLPLWRLSPSGARLATAWAVRAADHAQSVVCRFGKRFLEPPLESGVSRLRCAVCIATAGSAVIFSRRPLGLLRLFRISSRIGNLGARSLGLWSAARLLPPASLGSQHRTVNGRQSTRAESGNERPAFCFPGHRPADILLVSPTIHHDRHPAPRGYFGGNAVTTLETLELASGNSLLGRAFCAFVAIFWFCRLLIGLLVFDAKPYLRNWFLTLGYHGLTLVFTFHVLVYGTAALQPFHSTPNGKQRPLMFTSAIRGSIGTPPNSQPEHPRSRPFHRREYRKGWTLARDSLRARTGPPGRRGP